MIKLKAKTYSDAAYVEGVIRHDREMERALYECCKRYFDDNYRGVFFIGDEVQKMEVFQNAFITLWENIERKRIRVEDGVLKGKDGNLFTSSLTTYFMGIAKLKYLEWVREHARIDCEKEGQSRGMDLSAYRDLLYDDDKEAMLTIIADCISRMSERCNQIISMFYYEEKNLDDILEALPSFKSKDALKTAKHKCMENLRKTAQGIYHRYLNA